MKIQTNAPRGRVTLTLSIFTALFSAFLLWLGSRSISMEKRFANESVTAQGVITSKHMTERTERNKDTKLNAKVTSYYVTYQFATDRGRNIENDRSVSKETWDRINEKDQVVIQYLRPDPSQNRLADEDHASNGYVYIGLGIAASLIALFFFRMG